VLCALILVSNPLRALPGDADNSQDYPGFPRQPGFVISDYNEDNPAEADFPVSRPLPLDANHVEMVHVRGHRFVIRYELSRGSPPPVYQTQLFYEKLAAAGGFQVAKSGAVGDVTETFCRAMANHDIWINVEPSNDVNVVTVVEAPLKSTPIPGEPQRLAVTPSSAPVTARPIVPEPTPPPAPPAPANEVTPVPATPPTLVRVPRPAVTHVSTPEVTPVPATGPEPAPTPAPALAPAPQPAPVPTTDLGADALYTSLTGQGRIVVPFSFQPNRDELDASSQPVVDRIVAMMKKHPDLYLRIEGHTDNTGDPEDNMRLSTARAYAVRGRIIEGDIDKKRLDAVGVGGLQPLADNATAEGREKNRRIELVVWKRYSHREPAPGSTTGA
jgi:outer membrane protein OmpA-like peptidoglycan-associated protein